MTALIINKLKEIINQMATLEDENDWEAKIILYNKLSQLSQMLIGINHPILSVQLLPISKLTTNQFNPNVMASPEFKLLERSIAKDGITTPLLVNKADSQGNYSVIDGFHRLQLLKKNLLFYKLNGVAPAVIVDKNNAEQISSLVRHNLARGVHQVELTSALIVQLSQQNWNDNRICEELGMDKDEVLRMKQVTGLAAAFKNNDFNKAWE